MFCLNCGNELRQGLKYCNRCGAVISAEIEKSFSAIAENKTAQALSIAIGWIGVAGILALAFLINKLLQRDGISAPHGILVLIFAVLIFGIIFVVARQISILYGKKLFPFRTDSENSSRDSLPRADNTLRLEQFREPAASVTEHTTRAFDEAFVKKSEN